MPNVVVILHFCLSLVDKLQLPEEVVFSVSAVNQTLTFVCPFRSLEDEGSSLVSNIFFFVYIYVSFLFLLSIKTVGEETIERK